MLTVVILRVLRDEHAVPVSVAEDGDDYDGPRKGTVKRVVKLPTNKKEMEERLDRIEAILNALASQQNKAAAAAAASPLTTGDAKKDQ